MTYCALSIKGKFKKLYFHELREGPPVGKAVEINIRGDGKS